MGTDKRDKKREVKLFLTWLIEAAQPSGLPRPKELDASLLTSDLITRIKGSLGCIVMCSFMMLNWKTWHLHFRYGELTIHFPRLLGLSLIEGAIIGLSSLRVHKHYKWGMRVVAAAILVAISADLRPGLLDKPWLRIPILLLWAAGILAFLFCMMLLFMRMDVYKVGVHWFAATILMILLCIFLLLSLVGTLIHPTLGLVLFIISLVIFFIFGLTLIDAFLVTIIKWSSITNKYKR